MSDVGWLSRLLANIPVAAFLAMAAGMVPAGGQPVAAAGVVSGVAVAALPALARQSLRLVGDLTAASCPELPPLRVVAQVQAAAGGRPWTSDPPAVGTGFLSPEEHLRIAIPRVCTDLRTVTAHRTATGKPTAPLDATLVCRVAGCARVAGSRTGVPAGGEAGCDERCAQLVQRYIAAVHNNLLRFAATPTSAPPSSLSAASPIPSTHGEAAGPVGLVTPAAWRGGATGCSPPDPTGSGGCLTGATRHGLEAVGAAFGGWRGGPTIHSTGCWDRHAWNPSSDHSRGKACDFMVTRPGTFAQGAELANGWKLAHWLRANAGPLQVKYVIWQGRYWDPNVHDDPGNWGTRYAGAGIYDVRTATGGHYDHVHASFRE